MVRETKRVKSARGGFEREREREREREKERESERNKMRDIDNQISETERKKSNCEREEDRNLMR